MRVIERKASDNKYLHRDFHISMNMLMQYIQDKYGSKALTDYLKQFSREFHSLRKACLMKGELNTLKEYFIDVYKKEEWPVEITLVEDVLSISQVTCPGISHLIKNGQKPVNQYIETYTTIYETLCENTPYQYVMVNFDIETGACRQHFQRRQL